MKIWGVVYLAFAFLTGITACAASEQAATVTEGVNDVRHGPQSSSDFVRADKGTSVRDGEAVKTGSLSRAELELPTSSVTRLGANTIFNYSLESNEVDLQAGTVLFSKPRGAKELNIKTAAVTAGIVGTTGFMSIQGEGKKRTYILGLINGHATAHADNHPFLLGPGDILEFRPGQKPFLFAFDVPRFVKSSSLLHKFHSQLPTQAAIDAELADYADDVSRGFIVPPSSAIDYSGDIPILSSVAYSSAQNAQGQGQSSKGGAQPVAQSQSSPPPPPPPSHVTSTVVLVQPSGNSGPYNNTGH